MAGWPFAGRGGELARLTLLAREAALVIAGPAGTGKSRLAGEVVRGFSTADYNIAHVRATSSARGIPYGALAHLLPAEAPAHQVNPLRWTAEALGVRGRRLLLAVDDAHLLDASSAATVHYLVANAGAHLVATIRTGEVVSDGIMALWKDGLATRVEIGPFTLEDTALVLEARLGKPADATTVHRLHAATQGNALILCELVTAALDSGGLTEERGMWRMNSVPPPSPRLTELVQGRIGSLSRDQNAVLEYVALAEPLGLDPLTHLCGLSAVEEAEERGLIQVAPDDGRIEVRLTHPLYGEVARALLPPLRRRARFSQLAETVARYGTRRREDPLRLTLWQVESGMGAPPEPLINACRLAWSAHDYPLAIRLGQLALASGGGIQAALLLATVLDNAQLPDDARAVLEALPTPADPELRLQITLAKASNLAWGMNQLDDALALLDPSVPALAVRRLSLLASAARPAQTLALADELQHSAQVTNAKALALLQSGRTEQAAASVRAALAEKDWLDAAPMLVSPLHSTWSMAGLFAGDLALMQEAVTSMEAAAADQHGWSRGEGSLALARGHLAMARGEPRTALTVLHAAAHHQTATTVGGCMGAYAAALAMLGDAAGAKAALDEARRRNRPTWTAFTHWVALTEVAIAAASGETARAVSLALDAAATAHASGLPGFEFLALHEVVRLGGTTGDVTTRLAELVTVHDGARIRLAYDQARHATNAPALFQIADDYLALGMMLYAAETTAQASAVFRRKGSQRQAIEAETRALALAAGCQGADTPALRGLAAPELTPRQWQIVRLVVDGLSNREIAEQLFLSKRTVDNHLVAIYERTGIEGRADLNRLLPVGT